MAIIIQDQAPIIKTYSVGGTPTDTFNWPYRLFKLEDLKAYVDGNSTPVTFTLDPGSSLPTEGQPASSGVNIVLDNPISNAVLVLVGDLPIQRSVNFPVNGIFPIETLNEQLNEIFAILQEQETRLDRTLAGPVYSTGDFSDISLPDPTNGYLLMWNGNSGEMINVDSNTFQGPVGAPGDPGLVWRGTYNAGTSYDIDDAVFYNGSAYISLSTPNLNNTPDVSPLDWGLLAQKGADGAGTGDMQAATYDPGGVAGPVAFRGTVNTFTGQQHFNMTVLADAANIDWDLDLNQVTEVTLGGNRTMNAPTNLRAGSTYILFVKQDGFGNRTLTWDATFKFTGGTPPPLSTGVNAVDIITFVCDGTSLYGVGQLNFV